MRIILLWCSRSIALRKLIPRFAFVRRAVKRFMPGEKIEDALNAAETLRTHNLSAVVTHLGENLSEEREANEVAEHYLRVLELIKKRNLECQISLKLTQLGLDLNEELCYNHMIAIIRRAKELGNMVWIDMESSSYVDKTISVFKRIRKEYSNVGICLQSYLYRTKEDVESLILLSSSIRLVKGTYAEPKHIAMPLKKDVDENFLLLTQIMLKAVKANDTIVGIGTHDENLIERISNWAEKEKISKGSFELQMLYGIKREKQLQYSKAGLKVRTLISYGTFWFPWYMRRLAERPANVFFVLKSMFAR